MLDRGSIQRAHTLTNTFQFYPYNSRIKFCRFLDSMSGGKMIINAAILIGGGPGRPGAGGGGIIPGGGSVQKACTLTTKIFHIYPIFLTIYM